MRGFRTLVQNKAGMAVPVLLAIMLVAVLLSGVAASLAIQDHQFTQRDSGSKAAIEAANAGLRTAVYRLNAYQPGSNQCPTPALTPVGQGAPAGNLCAPDGPDVPQGLGNGASFTYWVSEAMTGTDTCTGPPVSGSGVVQRCITALGTANGVSARAQERVAGYASTPTFPTALFGTKSVTIGNNVTITTDTPGMAALIGTNGQLHAGSCNNQGGGNTVIDGYQLPPGASACIGGNVIDAGPTTGIGSPYPVPVPHYPLSSASDTSQPFDTSTTFQGGTCSMAEAQGDYGWTGSAQTWQQTNCDYEITRGITYPACLNGLSVVSDCDLSSGSINFDPQGHTLYLGNNSSLVLSAGYYYFCSLYLGNNAHITVIGGQATIFIDSPPPADPTSACSTSNSAQGIAPGTFTMTQNSSINPGGSALDAQILIFGDPANPASNAVNLTNNASSSLALSAPYSTVNISPSSNGTFTGAITGYTVTVGQAANFTYEADTKNIQSGAAPVFYPSSWEQCGIGGYSPSTPTSGC